MVARDNIQIYSLAGYMQKYLTSGFSDWQIRIYYSTYNIVKYTVLLIDIYFLKNLWDV